MTNKRVFQQPLKQEWADALLNCVPAFSEPGAPEKGPSTLGERCSEARSLWQTMLFEVREVIKNHPLAPLVAQRAAREAGKRGKARLVVNDAGDILLEVSYKTAVRDPAKTVQPVVKEKLQTLDLLRAVGVRLGVDISDLGRKKKLIIARLVENGWKPNGSVAKAPVAPKAPPHKKRTKRAPAITKAKVGLGPFKLDQDLADIFESPKSVPSKPRIDMEAIVAGAVPLDLKEFLKSDETGDGHGDF